MLRRLLALCGSCAVSVFASICRIRRERGDINYGQWSSPKIVKCWPGEFGSKLAAQCRTVVFLFKRQISRSIMQKVELAK